MAFWLWDLGYPALSGDEAYVATAASQPLSSIFQHLNSDEPHPPTYYVLMHSWSLDRLGARLNDDTVLLSMRDLLGQTRAQPAP
jgi:hypothetical protein